MDGYEIIAKEIARRLRENDARGDDAALRELGAQTIDQLCEQRATLKRLLAKYGPVGPSEP